MNTHRSTSLLAALVACGIWVTPAVAQTDNPAALARAMQDAKTTLEAGLKASEHEGKPISAKFEIEDGKLQLSVYTTKDNGFAETVLNPTTGAVAKTEKITGGEDLKEANVQSGAMATAKLSLLTATETAVKANAGFRAVSAMPEIKESHSVAVVTLLQGTNFKKVIAVLD